MRDERRKRIKHAREAARECATWTREKLDACYAQPEKIEMSVTRIKKTTENDIREYVSTLLQIYIMRRSPRGITDDEDNDLTEILKWVYWYANADQNERLNMFGANLNRAVDGASVIFSTEVV